MTFDLADSFEIFFKNLFLILLERGHSYKHDGASIQSVQPIDPEKKRVYLVTILVYFNLITIYKSMGTAKSPLGMKSWTGNVVYVSMDTCFTEKR